MLLYITRKYPPSIGGMQRFNFKLVKYLRDKTKLYVIAWGGSQIFLPFFLSYSFLMGIILCSLRPIKCIYIADALLSPLGYLIKLFTNKPVVVSVHGRDIAYPLRFYQRLVCFSLRKMDKIVCVSGKLKEECIKRNVSVDKIIVIPNGVDVEDFTLSSEVPPESSVLAAIKKESKNRKILLTVGRLVPKKGINSFIKNILPGIITTYSDILYVVVGDGYLRSNIEALIADYNLKKNILLLGEVKMDGFELAAIYNMADIFIMPNVQVLDDMEGFGIVALEAAAAGIPVVASNVDGISEAIVDGQNGFLLEPNNFYKFINKIIELLKNDMDRVSFGKKAQLYVLKNYSWEVISEKYLEVFRSLSAEM